MNEGDKQEKKTFIRINEASRNNYNFSFLCSEENLLHLKERKVDVSLLLCAFAGCKVIALAKTEAKKSNE